MTIGDSRIARWLQVDPLAEKYPGWSPYNYVMDNPLKFIDTDGRKVRFGKNCSPEFIDKFTTAVFYMNEKGTSSLLRELDNSPSIYYIEESSSGTYFSSKEQTISWNPDVGVLTTEMIVVSPVTVLNHEIDHAVQHDTNPEQMKADRKATDPDYSNLEEKRVITGSEQITAKKHGEIKNGQVTRKDHFGFPVKVEGGPTSNKSKESKKIIKNMTITVIGKKEKK